MTFTVLATGPLTTIQDRGRPGLAHLGVPRAGALDGRAAGLGLRLVGTETDDALLEVTLGGFAARAERSHWVAVTGAPCPVTVDGRQVAHGEAVFVPAGAELRLGEPWAGVRSYVAVAGGIDVDAVLGSRSTDTLGWVGPPRVEEGMLLPVGEPSGTPFPLDTPRTSEAGTLRLLPGPRADWFEGDAVAVLCAAPYTVQTESNRVGLRLEGSPLARAREEELPSEGMVWGAVQVPPSGQPVVFLADHPPTGGYPVVAVVDRRDLWQCAQLQPGDEIRFTRARTAARD